MSHQTLGAELLRQKMLARGDAAKLARALEINTGTVSMWTSGRRTPRVATLVALRDMLGIPIEAWAQRIPQKRRNKKAA